jgi:cytosine/adenosine deaminase-related metal-dependent hydrolase
MNEPLIMDGVRIYGMLDRGNLWCMIRATDKATFDAQALDVGLTVHMNPAVPAVTDPETGDIITPAVEASGPIVPARGVTITELGPHVLTPAVYDVDGAVVTPAVLDTRHHVNFWLNADIVARGEWMRWSTYWTYYGAVIIPNNAEDGADVLGIELIDPATVDNPRNVLL